MNIEQTWHVIHLSTGHKGGSGLAARRLNSALNKAGISSSFWAIKHLDYYPGENEFQITRNQVTRLISRILSSVQSRLSGKTFFSIWSLNVLSNRRINRMGKPENTILHFHNWFNLVSQKKMLQLSNQGFNIVLTMHDERFLTGGCHYAFQCKGFQASCQRCPELPRILRHIPSNNLNKISKIVKNVNDRFVLISPSRWLRDEALSASLTSHLPVVFIPNTLDFKVNENVSINRIQVLKVSPILNIGVASMSKGFLIKGGDITSNLQKLILERHLPIKMIYLSDFEIDNVLESEFWTQIDYLLVPSRADNSPNVIHEAKLLGIPVIASSLDGIAELLTPGYDVPISAAQLNVDGILDILLKVNPKHDKEIKKIMAHQFNEYVKDSVRSHISVYEGLVRRQLGAKTT